MITNSLASANQWQPIAGGGGGASLPSLSGQSGKFLTNDGTNASWGVPAGGVTLPIAQSDVSGLPAALAALAPLSSVSSVVVKTADQTENAAGMVDATDLAFAVLTGGLYQFAFLGEYASDTLTTGVGLGVNAPATTVFNYAVAINGRNADGTTHRWNGSKNASNSVVLSSATNVINNKYLYEVRGLIKPSADGTLKLRFRSGAAATTVTLYANAVGLLTRLA